MVQLEKAMEQYEKLIFSICYRMLGDYFDAQDMTQETFLTYYKVLDRFDGQNEKAFLTKIATNKCLDFLKSKRRKEMPTEDGILESNVGTVSSLEESFLEKEISAMPAVLLNLPMMRLPMNFIAATKRQKRFQKIEVSSLKQYRHRF